MLEQILAGQEWLEIFKKPVRAFKIDNDKHLSKPIPHLQFVGQIKLILGSGPNPVHSGMGGWQPDVCPPQLQFSLIRLDKVQQ